MSSRLPSRLCVPWGRLVLSIRSSRCLLVSFLIRLVFHLVWRLVGRLVSPSRLACPSHSSCCRFPWSSRYIPLPSSLRLVISSCRGVLLARLVSFPFTFLIALRIWIGRSCWVGRIIPMSMRLVPLLLVSSLIVRFVAMMRYPFPSCVIRHPVVRQRGRQGMGRTAR